MTDYWIIVAPKNHVTQGIEGGFAQTCHGKAHPLRRMNVGDGLLYYSPKLENGGNVAYQRFTGIGCVVGPDIYKHELTNNAAPYRRNVKFLSSRDAPIAPLISRLSFIKEKERWGGIFKFSILHIPEEDFHLIAKSMNVELRG